MRWLIAFLLVLPAFAAAPSCSYSTGGGVTVASNVSFDATIPSGQTYSRTVAFAAYPTGATDLRDIFIIGPGNGFVEQVNICTSSSAFATALVNRGYSVFSIYTSKAAAAQIVASHSIGDTSLTIQAILNSAGNLWWPNATCSVDGCQGISVPFTAIYGSAAAGDQETVTITAQSGAGLVNTVNALTKNHAANENIYLPKTEYPSNVGDWSSFFNWLGANAATYHGNAQRIHLAVISSDAHGAFMAAMSNHSICLASCSPLVSYWGSSVGNDGGSSNSATAWNVVDANAEGMPWDLLYMYNNGQSGAGVAVQSIVTQLMGCVPGTDTGCSAAATAASPNALMSTSAYHGPMASATGTNDVTTPCVVTGTSTPFAACSANNMYALSGKPFVLFSAAPDTGHGGSWNTHPDSTGASWNWLMTQGLGGQAASASASGAP